MTFISRGSLESSRGKHLDFEHWLHLEVVHSGSAKSFEVLCLTSPIPRSGYWFLRRNSQGNVRIKPKIWNEFRAICWGWQNLDQWIQEWCSNDPHFVSFVNELMLLIKHLFISYLSRTFWTCCLKSLGFPESSYRWIMFGQFTTPCSVRWALWSCDKEQFFVATQTGTCTQRTGVRSFACICILSHPLRSFCRF